MKKKKNKNILEIEDWKGYRPGLVYSPGIGWKKPVEPEGVEPGSVVARGILTPEMKLKAGLVTRQEYNEIIQSRKKTKCFSDMNEEERRVFSESIERMKRKAMEGIDNED